MAEFTCAALHGQHPGEQLEKSRFPCAIRADKHSALTALGMKLHSAINNHVAIGMIDIFQRDHAQPAAHRLWEMELDRLSARDRAGCARMIQQRLRAWAGRWKSVSRKASPARTRFAFGSSSHPPCSSKTCSAL